jgi:hypothetical protein
VLYSAIYKWEILHSWDLSVWSLRLYGAMYCYVASLVFAEVVKGVGQLNGYAKILDGRFSQKLILLHYLTFHSLWWM